MSSEKAIEFFWSNIKDIKATLTSCSECDGETVIKCPTCLGLSDWHCNKCGKPIDDGQSNCSHCIYGNSVKDCPDCTTGYLQCPKCNGKGYEIEYIELDGKQAATIEELWLEFTPKVLR
jgi:hypothetical protein